MRQIRFLKDYWARIPGEEPHPDLQDLVIGPAMKSYKFEAGDIPGVAQVPQLPDVEVEWSEADPEGGLVEVMRAGETKKKVKEIKRTGLLYDRLVDLGLAMFLGVESPNLSFEEQSLMKMEKVMGIPIEDLDSVYREHNARSVAQKIEVLSQIQNARTTESAEALAKVGGTRKAAAKK